MSRDCQAMSWRTRLWSGSSARSARPALAALDEKAEPKPTTDHVGHSRAERDGAALPPLLLTNPVAVPDEPADDCPYLTHFGLAARPFSLLPDPDFIFWSPAHRRAQAVLEYGLMSRAPLTVVTGEIGAGKTTLVHHFLRKLGASVRVGLISNASGLRGELLYWVLSALGESPSGQADHAVLFEAFQTYLIKTYGTGRRVVLIFDEAQTLGRERLEELRMLTNINTGTDVLVQIVLVGQPELRDVVLQPDMWQFAQRVAATFHLPAMEAETQRAYINHRLSVAGASHRIFEESALATIFTATRGVPRLTNQLCDLAMLYAYSADKPVVNLTCVQHVLDDGVLLGARPQGTGSPAQVAPAAKVAPAAR